MEQAAPRKTRSCFSETSACRRHGTQGGRNSGSKRAPGSVLAATLLPVDATEIGSVRDSIQSKCWLWMRFHHL